MIYIGLDQALANTGIAVYLPTENKIVVTTLQTTNKVELFNRFYLVQQFFKNLFDQIKPDKVFMEKVSQQRGSNPIATSYLMRVEVIIKLILIDKLIPYESFSASMRDERSWRRTLGIGSNTTKSDVIEKVKKLLYLDKSAIIFKLNEHEAEAICILLTGLVLENQIKLQSLAVQVEKIDIKDADSKLQSLVNLCGMSN